MPYRQCITSVSPIYLSGKSPFLTRADKFLTAESRVKYWTEYHN